MVLLEITSGSLPLLHIPHVAMTEGLMWDIATPVSSAL